MFVQEVLGDGKSNFDVYITSFTPSRILRYFSYLFQHYVTRDLIWQLHMLRDTRQV